MSPCNCGECTACEAIAFERVLLERLPECEFCQALAIGHNPTTELSYCAEHEELAECPHEESECSICNYCGAAVDWVARTFKESN